MDEATLSMLGHIRKTFDQIVRLTADQASSLYYAWVKDENMQPGQYYHEQLLNLEDIARGNVLSSREAFLQSLDFAIDQLQVYGGGGVRGRKRIDDLLDIRTKIRNEAILRERYRT